MQTTQTPPESAPTTPEPLPPIIEPTPPAPEPAMTIPAPTPAPPEPAQTVPLPSQTPIPAQPTTPPQDWRDIRYQDRMQRRVERHTGNQQAGIPVWGVLLVLVGIIAFLGNFGLGFGWIFGLALGAWFVYLGARSMQEGKAINWWLVGLGLLIGLGATTSGLAFANDNWIFPIVLVLVGVGILGEHYLSGQNQG